MDYTFRFSGSPPEDIDVELLRDQALSIAAQVLYREANEVLKESQEIVPVDQGTLRASALQIGVVTSRGANEVKTQIGYGGAAKAYAVVQHETPPGVYSHAPGKAWHYLSDPAKAHAKSISDSLREALKRLGEDTE